MPNITIRLQNSSGATMTLVSTSENHMVWNQQPPNSLNNNASSSNIQLAYHENALPVDFTMNYSIPNQVTNFTASGYIEEDGNLSWSGAAPPGYIVRAGTSTSSTPNFLFTFDVEG